MSALRYARQYVLPEIGTGGQARIEACLIAPGTGDARASEIALAYLERAGMTRSLEGEALTLAATSEIERIAGRVELREAAAFLVGALGATACIAAVTGAPARPLTAIPTLSG